MPKNTFKTNLSLPNKNQMAAPLNHGCNEHFISTFLFFSVQQVQMTILTSFLRASNTSDLRAFREILILSRRRRSIKGLLHWKHTTDKYHKYNIQTASSDALLESGLSSCILLDIRTCTTSYNRVLNLIDRHVWHNNCQDMRTQQKINTNKCE